MNGSLIEGELVILNYTVIVPNLNFFYQVIVLAAIRLQ